MNKSRSLSASMSMKQGDALSPTSIPAKLLVSNSKLKLSGVPVLIKSVIPLSQQIGKKVRKCHSGKRSVTGIGELYYKMYVFFRLRALERIPGKPE